MMAGAKRLLPQKNAKNTEDSKDSEESRGCQETTGLADSLLFLLVVLVFFRG
jgi:hypothetical protein